MKLSKGSMRLSTWLRQSDFHACALCQHLTLAFFRPAQFDEEDPKAWVNPSVSGATGILKSLQKHK
jgi:hypothetical protein